MRRLFILLLGIGLISLSWSQTKADLKLPEPTKFSGDLGFSALLQLIVALVLVIGGLKFLLPRLAPALSKRLNPGLSGRIKIEESATFPGGALYIVRIEEQEMLLSVSQTGGVSKIADLTQNPTSDAFFEVLDQKSAQPVPEKRVVKGEGMPPTRAVVADPGLALERLKRLTSGPKS